MPSTQSYTRLVPLGGGLSSSAALEVATHTFLEALEGRKVITLTLVELIILINYLNSNNFKPHILFSSKCSIRIL